MKIDFYKVIIIYNIFVVTSVQEFCQILIITVVGIIDSQSVHNVHQTFFKNKWTAVLVHTYCVSASLCSWFS